MNATATVSLVHADRPAAKPAKVRKVRVASQCSCIRLGVDCGRTTFGTWAPGHDAKAKGLLQRAHRNDEPVLVDGHEVTARQAAEELVPAIVGMLYYRKGTMSARFADDDAAMADSAKSAQVKVGRWVYNALIAGDAVTYADKAGKVHTLPLAEANLVTAA